MWRVKTWNCTAWKILLKKTGNLADKFDNGKWLGQRTRRVHHFSHLAEQLWQKCYYCQSTSAWAEAWRLFGDFSRMFLAPTVTSHCATVYILWQEALSACMSTFLIQFTLKVAFFQKVWLVYQITKSPK